jgi:hypothetical protein
MQKKKKIGEKKGLSNDVSNWLSKNSGGFGVGGTNWLQIGSIQNKTQKIKYTRSSLVVKKFQLT